ncbi:MAG: biotin transporter BioY [Clostridiales bacterium]|nr:biotin transporter BioY [Clostridiales bacterium]
MRQTRTTEMILSAMFAALSAVLSQISIPIGLVPINLTHVSVFLAAGLLGARYGAFSQIAFVLMGAFGIPVFSGFAGGAGIIAGPTGGFIIGYICCAFVSGLIINRFGKSMKVLIPAMYAGWFASYIPGVLWFMHVTGVKLAAALPFCVLPFLPGDAAKTVLSAALVNRLQVPVQNVLRRPT